MAIISSGVLSSVTWASNEALVTSGAADVTAEVSLTGSPVDATPLGATSA